MRPALLFQLGCLALCGFLLTELAISFPWPSPVIRPFLPPKLRWPTEEVKGWVESRKFDPGFADYFNRDPERTVPPGPSPVSSADGMVKALLYDPSRSEIVIGLSFWDVHVVRTPEAGIVKSVQPGGRIDFRPYSEVGPNENPADDVALRGKDAPVQAIITIASDMGDIQVRMITSYWASRLRVWVHPGQHLAKGERIGRILLGSTVAVAFPPDLRFSVAQNQHVTAGETTIAKR